ncbi:MAG: DUF1553 domain-containing protein [Planctomycetota bacterium]|nr:DUF1553 domain-containing protein [Planctomycetota bacterium]
MFFPGMPLTRTAVMAIGLLVLASWGWADSIPTDGLVLWLDASDPDGDGLPENDPDDGTKLSRWNDKSGRGNHVEQQAAGRQPSYRHTAFNDRPAIQFQGQSLLQVAGLSGLRPGDQPLHGVLVMRAKMVPAHPNPRLLDLRSDHKKIPAAARRGFWVGYQQNGRNRLGIAYGDEGQARSVLWDGKTNLLEVVYEGGGRWAQYRNAVLDGSGVFAGRTFLGFREKICLAIGQHYGFEQINTFYVGELAEVLLYSRVLSNVEQNALGVYLSRKYQLDTAYGTVPQFEKDVLPILARSCHKCHGEKKREGKLDLRTVSAMLTGGDSGAALVRGHPERSYLLEMIGSGEMPPKNEKKLVKGEVALLQRWVRLGAPTDERIVLPSATDLYRDEHRQHWAFRPPAGVDPPTVRQQNLVHTPIDAFVLRRLEADGLSFSPRAEPATLARRAWFDLTGLPPTPGELRKFLEDEAGDSFANLIDRLLDSPAYGQRWARHWLDIVRYADYYDADAKARQLTAEPLDAWRYRDWVVDSLNRDLPFDEFIVHQIAGDLLPNPDGSKVYPAGLIATTFLSNGVWDPHDADKEKIVSDMADDNIDTIGQAFLGLTLGCARCHDHKFDPVSTEDYYALAGIFYSSHFIEKLGTKGGAYTMNRVPLVSAADIARRQAQVKQLGEIEAQLKALDKRPPQPADDDPERQRLISRRGTLQRELSPETPRAIAVQEGGTPGGLFPGIQDVPVHIRGSYTRLGRVIPRRLPRFFVGEPSPPIGSGSGRRELADWVASKTNPLTARVIVNRVWQWHFGEGLVRTPNNFGMRSEPPTHPGLLDWLAVRFIADGWSLKKLHRQIMLSNTYQQSGKILPGQLNRDPDNRWLGRFMPRRLEAEAIRDAMLFAAGRLDSSLGGPAGDDLMILRRSLYVQTARWNRSNYASLFDAANPDASTPKRVVSTVAPQSLFLMNNEFALTQARSLAKRLLREVSRDETARIVRAYRILFGRPANSAEIEIARELLGEVDDDDPLTPWADLVHVLFCSNEFVYLD